MTGAIFSWRWFTIDATPDQDRLHSSPIRARNVLLERVANKKCCVRRTVCAPERFGKDVTVWLARLRLLFFFQAEDGIRDGHVTGVQTCALPISTSLPSDASSARSRARASS